MALTSGTKGNAEHTLLRSVKGVLKNQKPSAPTALLLVQHHVDEEQENDQVVDRDETDPYNKVIFGRRRPDSVAVDWTSKVLYILEFKRTSDQRQNYREHGESRARAQHDVLVKSLEKVAGEVDEENGGWRIKLIVLVGGTCGSVHSYDNSGI
jgi:hypothetical protein